MASAPSVPPPPPPPPPGTDGPTPPVSHPDALLPAANGPVEVGKPAPIPATAPGSKARPDAEPAPPPPQRDVIAGLLSYLIPGLGQVYQGRIGKGLLFFGGLYLLFFYGMWMGQWRNVWLPDVADQPDVEIAGQRLGGWAKAVAYRPQFLAQFWIGTAAWPAVIQYANYDKDKKAGPLFGTFQRVPPEEELNELQRNGDKRWDLGWVYTVIAGVLNLLVIYDAFAGPMFRDPPPGPGRRGDEPTTW